MKVRIEYTVDVDEEFRKALRHYKGKTGLATRGEIKIHFIDYGHLQDDDIISTYREHEKRKKKQKESPPSMLQELVSGFLKMRGTK